MLYVSQKFLTMPNDIKTKKDIVPMSIRLLDFVFNVIIQYEFEHPNITSSPSEIMQLIQETRDDEMKLYFNPASGKLLHDILNHLGQDGYVKCDKSSAYNDRKYYTTFKGGLHKYNGGYAMEHLNRNQARNHAEQVEKAMLVNNKWMRMWALVAAVAAACLVLIEIGKHYHALLQIGFGWVLSIQLMTFLFVACLTLIAGILLGVLLTALLRQRK